MPSSPPSDTMAPVAIAGATGFVGRALSATLSPRAPIIGLSRRSAPDSDGGRVRQVACNLFNLLQAERALAGARLAIYLVHSMSPAARLAQGHFEDMDLICADNFARAAKAAGVERIIYLGGLMPQDDALSRHLRSRLEVEEALASHGVPLTTLRAGLVLGVGGSSFEMMVRLVKRLPLMVVPRWTQSLTQPIALDDAVALLNYVIDHPDTAGETYDIGCPDVLSYAQMLRQTAELMGGRPTPIVPLPVDTAKISLLWVSLITQTPLQLVAPLVESLQHDMVARDGLRLQVRAQIKARSFRQAMQEALAAWGGRAAPRTPSTSQPPARRGPAPISRVLSVQRLPLPPGRDAEWVADEYARWLPQFLRPLVRVDIQEGRVFRFFLPFMRRPLLVLSFAPQRSSGARQLFYITDGALVRGAQPEPGRFEFRLALHSQVCLAAVHDFVPSLPWLVYKFSQAVAHRLIMLAFGRHLRRDKGAVVASG